MYNYILAMHFASTLDVVASPIQLKLKYHNVHDKSVIININILGEKWIYKALQQHQKEGEAKAMEINVSSLIKQLKDMAIQPSPIKVN